MRVNPNSELPVVGATSAPVTASGARLGEDQTAFATSDTLNRALALTPDVRAEKVAEAKALLEHGTYPPEVIIQKISALLAIKISSKQPAE